MKRIPYAALAAVMLIPVIADAQPKAIRIKQGETLEYTVNAQLEMTQLTGENEAVVRVETGGIAQLRARRISHGRIEWTYQTPDVKLTRVSDGSEPGTSSETIVESTKGTISTDSRGRVVSGLRLSESESLTPLMEAMHRSMVKLWFQPAIFRKLKPGDTWTEKRDDRIVVADMGIDVHARYNVDYHFDGIVDTLGIKAVRVTWHAARMTIAGTRTVDGKSSPVEGDGDHYGTSYFSTIDGLVLATVSDNTVDLRVTPKNGSQPAIPMTWRLHSESLRR